MTGTSHPSSKGHPVPTVTRRQVLSALALAPVAALVPYAIGDRDAAVATRLGRASGGVVRSALHVHTSFSEGSDALSGLHSRSTMASAESQVDTMSQLGIDLVYFTDHDHLMNGQGSGRIPRTFPDLEDLTQPHWTYRPNPSGSVLSGASRLTPRGLEASVSAGASPAWQLMFADCGPTGRDYRSTLAGLSLALTLTHGTPDGWTELRLWTSYRPARSGRSAGTYELHYRFDPTATSRTVTTTGTTAVVTAPTSKGTTQRHSMTPTDDLLEAFPDLGVLAQDGGLYGIWIGVGAAAGRTAGTVATRLELTRTMTGAAALDLQNSFVTALAGRYPSVVVGPGVEASYEPHLNLFAASRRDLSTAAPVPGASITAYLDGVVAALHAAGGVATVNHPFGANTLAPLTGAARTAHLAAVAAGLFSADVYRADVLEVGYARRGAMDVRGHLDLWDILLSAGVRIMADGVSDDHAGTVHSWTSSPNTYVTDIISPSSHPAVTTPLIGQGRSFVSQRTGFAGLLDLASDGAAMGGTRSGTGSTADIAVTADGLPSGARVEVVQHAVHGDRSRLAAPRPIASTVLAPSRFHGGTTTVSAANVPSYVRTEVRDRAGTLVAFSNPLWLAPA